MKIITLFAVQCLLVQALAHCDYLSALYDFNFSSDAKMSFGFVCTKEGKRKTLEFSFQEYLPDGDFRFCLGVLQGRLALEKSKLILEEQKNCLEIVTNRVMGKVTPLTVEPSLSLTFSEYRNGDCHGISFSVVGPTNFENEVSHRVLESYSNFYSTVKAVVGVPETSLYQSWGKESDGTGVIPFSDAFYTPFRYLRRKIVCQGALEKDDGGIFYLRPIDGELDGMDHLAHVQRLPRIHLQVPDCSQRAFDSYTGMPISVVGILSSVGDENVGQHELESGFVCLQSPKVIHLGESLSPKDSCTSCYYASPCREFKLKLHTSDGFICLVHYYSARLWIARYVAKDGENTVCSTIPKSLYSTQKDLIDERKMTRLWRRLGKMERFFQNSVQHIECPLHGMIRSYRYAEINEIELYGEKCQELQSTVLDMFEDLEVGFPGRGSVGTSTLIP